MSAPMHLNLEHVTARKNKDGALRYYFRRRGQPVTRLHGEPLSEEFMAEYRKCLNWIAPGESISPATASAGSMSRGRTYTKAEIMDAAQAAAEAGVRVILHPTGEIEFTKSARNEGDE
ncbi:MAG TPA: hypothetical protein VHC00_00490 [Rhizobiaceae bacterium]|nr:hypothetical protein [Rhizobiaceae bacterium]